MNDRVLQFVREHPEFFELCNEYWRLNKDLSGLMERFAYAIDREEFELLRSRMEEVRQKERHRLQAEINDWLVEREREEARIQEADAELRGIETKLKGIEKRIHDLRRAAHDKPKPSKQWYHSGLVFLALALMGVTFLYLGIILNKKISPGYVIAGMTCILIGLFLQSGDSTAGKSTDNRQLLELTEEERRFQQIARIKTATLNERKRVAIKAQRQLSAKIDSNLDKIQLLNG